MKILIVTHDDKYRGGVDYHRMLAPFEEISRREGIEVVDTPHLEGVTSSELEQFDVCVFNRNISPTLNPVPVFEALRKAGVRIIIDIDDYWEVDPDHVLADFQNHSNLSKCLFDQMCASDMVWCTHKRLAHAITHKTGNLRVVVVPNGIDQNRLWKQMDLDHNIHDYEHFFWQGSSTHHYDLKLMAPALNETGVKFTLCGVDLSNPVWRDSVQMLPGALTEPMYPYYEYAKLYWDKGVAMIPLRDTYFNRMKSELKMIEAGWFSKAVIVSDIHPYTLLKDNGKYTRNCLTVGPNQNWSKAIRQMSESRQLQDDLRGRLHEAVIDRYNLAKINDIRVQALKSLC